MIESVEAIPNTSSKTSKCFLFKEKYSIKYILNNYRLLPFTIHYPYLLYRQNLLCYLATLLTIFNKVKYDFGHYPSNFGFNQVNFILIKA